MPMIHTEYFQILTRASRKWAYWMWLNKCHHATIFRLHRIELQATAPWGLCVLQILRDHDTYVRLEHLLQCQLSWHIQLFFWFLSVESCFSVLFKGFTQKLLYFHFYYNFPKTSFNWIIELFEMEQALNGHIVQLPCNVQGYLHLD